VKNDSPERDDWPYVPLAFTTRGGLLIICC
jgi:hypothetical protein